MFSGAGEVSERSTACECPTLWRAGEIITEIDGDDPGMPRHAPRERKALGLLCPGWRSWLLGLLSPAGHKKRGGWRPCDPVSPRPSTSSGHAAGGLNGDGRVL